MARPLPAMRRSPRAPPRLSAFVQLHEARRADPCRRWRPSGRPGTLFSVVATEAIAEVTELQLDGLEAGLAVLVARLHAGTCRRLLLGGELERLGNWAEVVGRLLRGVARVALRADAAPHAQARVGRSPAAGLSTRPRRLRPRGEVSYAKLRALTRVATARARLSRPPMPCARRSSSARCAPTGASHLPKRAPCTKMRASASLRRGGALALRGGLALEEGALLLRALNGARDSLWRGSRGSAEPRADAPAALRFRRRVTSAEAPPAARCLPQRPLRRGWRAGAARPAATRGRRAPSARARGARDSLWRGSRGPANRRPTRQASGRTHRRVTSAEARKPQEQPFVSLRVGESGSLALHGRLARGAGALLLRALEALSDHALAEATAVPRNRGRRAERPMRSSPPGGEPRGGLATARACVHDPPTTLTAASRLDSGDA